MRTASVYSDSLLGFPLPLRWSPIAMESHHKRRCPFVAEGEDDSSQRTKESKRCFETNYENAEDHQLRQVLMSTSGGPASPQIKSPLYPRIIKEKGENSKSSSGSRRLRCKICFDKAPSSSMFRNNNCSHSFCRVCLARYIGAKVQENIHSVKCPEIKCKGVFEPEYCREVIPGELFERWEAAQCEAMILCSQKFYCPFKDCSALLVDDGQEPVTQAECPNCHRLFCAQCKVAWHAGLSCIVYKVLGLNEGEKEDSLLKKIARKKKWQRCPKCRFFVDKNGGCVHMTCRCGFEFCYRCGSIWETTHERTCNN